MPKRAWYTLVGERGVTLSGGQKQRVTPGPDPGAPSSSVILLDDPVSHLDTRTDRAGNPGHQPDEPGCGYGHGLPQAFGPLPTVTGFM